MSRETLRDKIVDLLADKTMWIDSFDQGEAAANADDIISDVIATLRRDPRMPALTRQDWELLLADQRQRIESDLTSYVGWAPADDVIEAAADVVIEIVAAGKKARRKHPEPS